MSGIRPSNYARIGAGLALLVAALTVFLATSRPVLAHHAEVALEGDCSAWLTTAEYIGGDLDRKVVTDLWINDQHIQLDFYFDFGPGHLGHQDYWLLFSHSGSGSVWVHGTVTVFYRGAGGGYTGVDNIATVDSRIDCPTPTATSAPPSTETATPVPTDTAEPTATPTSPSTSTPTSESTDTPEATPTTGVEGSVTPLPTDTPSGSTSTPTTTASTNTPVPTLTPKESTSTPALVTTVESLQPPSGPDTPRTTDAPPQETASGLPSAGAGTRGTQGALMGALATILAGVGLAVAASGLKKAEL